MGQEILSRTQKGVLGVLSGERKITDSFYLTGGTALAAFYLNHRYSEDLDFFSEEEIDPTAVITILKKLKPKLGFTKIDLQTNFNRNIIFLNFPKAMLKTEFTYFPFTAVGKKKMWRNLKIDSIEDIAANKLFTIYQKPRARDFIDLYLILEEGVLDFGELLKKARIKFDWQIDLLTLGSQLLISKDISDYPRMIRKIKDGVWKDYFAKIARDLGKKIL